MADQTQIFLVFLIARNSHRKSSTKNLFLKIGQDSLEGNCAGVKPTQVYTFENCKFLGTRILKKICERLLLYCLKKRRIFW